MAENRIEDIKNNLNAIDILQYFSAKNINNQWVFLNNHSQNKQNLANNFYKLIAHTEKFFELIKKKSIEIQEAKAIFKKMIGCAKLFIKFKFSLIEEAGFVFEHKYKNQLINCISTFQFFSLNINHITEDFIFPKMLDSIPLIYATSLIESYNTKVIAGILVGKIKNCSTSMEDTFIAIISQYFAAKDKKKAYIKEIHDIFKFAILNARKIFYDTECNVILSFLEYLLHNPKITRYLISKKFDHKFEEYQNLPFTKIPKLENAAKLKEHEISINHKNHNEKSSQSHATDNIVNIITDKERSNKIKKIKNKNIVVNSDFITKQVKEIELKIKFAFMISDIDIIAAPLQKAFKIIVVEEKSDIAAMHQKYNAIARMIRRIIHFDGPIAQKVGIKMNLEEEIGRDSSGDDMRDSAEILEEFIEKRFEKLDQYVKNLIITN